MRLTYTSGNTDWTHDTQLNSKTDIIFTFKEFLQQKPKNSIAYFHAGMQISRYTMNRRERFKFSNVWSLVYFDADTAFEEAGTCRYI